MRMQTSGSADPWLSLNAESSTCCTDNNDNNFEDSFIDSSLSLTSSISASEVKGEIQKLPDSEQYLARLQSRLIAIQGGTSKRDLINSLSVAKEDCIARLITAGQNLESLEERELAANPLIRHIAPHLQALTASELVHLLKADALQQVVEEQNNLVAESEDTESKSTDSQPDIPTQDCHGL